MPFNNMPKEQLNRLLMFLRFEKSLEYVKIPARIKRLFDLYEINIPFEIPPFYLVEVASMQRRPHIRTSSSTPIIVHDRSYVDTVSWLEKSYIGKERPLINFVVLGKAFAELLYVGKRPGLGLYYAEELHKYVSKFRNDKELFVRPVNLTDIYENNFDLLKILQDGMTKAKLTGFYIDLQEITVVLHEIGHAFFKMDSTWREYWHKNKRRLINFQYYATPLSLDPKFGLSSIMRRNNMGEQMSEEVQLREKERLINVMVEEIACDWFALSTLIYSNAKRSIPCSQTIFSFFRFLLHGYVISVLRYYEDMRARNKIRYRSIISRIRVRLEAIFHLLDDIKLLPESKEQDFEQILKKEVRDLDLKELLEELEQVLKGADHILMLAAQDPNPMGGDTPADFIVKSLMGITGTALNDYSESFEKAFNDQYLSLLIESHNTRHISEFRATGKLITESRDWSYKFHNQRRGEHLCFEHFDELAKQLTYEEAKLKLNQTFREVTIDNIELIHRVQVKDGTYVNVNLADLNSMLKNR